MAPLTARQVETNSEDKGKTLKSSKATTLLSVVGALLFSAISTLAQQKLLTIDDIFDPAKKVNFSGSVPAIKWLKDGTHYLQTNDAKKNLPRIQKVNAVTGEAVPFFDAARMEAAFAAIPGITKQQAKELAGRGSYQLNPSETAV